MSLVRMRCGFRGEMEEGGKGREILLVERDSGSGIKKYFQLCVDTVLMSCLQINMTPNTCMCMRVYLSICNRCPLYHTSWADRLPPAAKGPLRDPAAPRLLGSVLPRGCWWWWWRWWTCRASCQAEAASLDSPVRGGKGCRGGVSWGGDGGGKGWKRREEGRRRVGDGGDDEGFRDGVGAGEGGDGGRAC